MKNISKMKLTSAAIFCALTIFPEVTMAAPLYTQCSTLPGTNNTASGGCNVLITITGGSPLVQVDPLAAGFGGEDSFVGVVNNATTPLFSLTLTSSLGIFGFDGDGTVGLGAYAPAGISFTGINATFTSGTVNFSGGLAPGATAAFELEQNLSTAGIPPPVIGSVPEPATLALFGLGIFGLIGLHRKSI